MDLRKLNTSAAGFYWRRPAETTEDLASFSSEQRRGCALCFRHPVWHPGLLILLGELNTANSHSGTHCRNERSVAGSSYLSSLPCCGMASENGRSRRAIPPKPMLSTGSICAVSAQMFPRCASAATPTMGSFTGPAPTRTSSARRWTRRCAVHNRRRWRTHMPAPHMPSCPASCTFGSTPLAPAPRSCRG